MKEKREPHKALDRPSARVSIYGNTATCHGENASPHPAIFLDLSKTGKAVCPYCSQVFEKVQEET